MKTLGKRAYERKTKPKRRSRSPVTRHSDQRFWKLLKVFRRRSPARAIIQRPAKRVYCPAALGSVLRAARQRVCREPMRDSRDFARRSHAAVRIPAAVERRAVELYLYHLQLAPVRFRFVFSRIPF